MEFILFCCRLWLVMGIPNFIISGARSQDSDLNITCTTMVSANEMNDDKSMFAMVVGMMMLTEKMPMYYPILLVPVEDDTDIICEKSEYVPLNPVPLSQLGENYLKKFGEPPQIGRAPPTDLTISYASISNVYPSNDQLGIDCGISSPGSTIVTRIVGDAERVTMSPTSIPWIVYLRGNRYVCAGVLISDQWVLTGAGCITGVRNVVIGTKNFRLNTTTTEFRSVMTEVIHEQYNATSGVNDIGLLELDYALVFNNFIRPICVPYPWEYFEFSKCYLVNWGRYDRVNTQLSDEVHFMYANVLSNYECHFRWILAGVVVNHDQICLEFTPSVSKSNICIKDTGGPVICTVRNVDYIVGIATSIESGCIYRFLPDRFATVTHYTEWITSKIKARQMDYDD